MLWTKQIITVHVAICSFASHSEIQAQLNSVYFDSQFISCVLKIIFRAHKKRKLTVELDFKKLYLTVELIFGKVTV